MKCLKLLLFVLLSFSVFPGAPVLELLDQQGNLLGNLSNLMQNGQQETLNLQNSLVQKEQEIKNWETYFQEYEQKTNDILKQKEAELKQKEKLLKASQESSLKDQTLLKSLSGDITSLENILNRRKLWSRISISVLIAMALIITVETIVIIKKK